MPLQEQSATNIKYLSIFQGYLTESTKTEREGFKRVETENPSTKETVVKFIKQYKALTAKIVSIEYNKVAVNGTTLTSWNLYLTDREDGEINYRLQLSANQNAAQRFLKMADNIDFSEPIEISAWLAVEEGKKKTAFVIKQNGQNVPQYWTKDNLPAPKQNPRTDKWDYSEQEDFLFTHMMDKIIPALHEMTLNNLSEKRNSSEKQEEINDDDIPF